MDAQQFLAEFGHIGGAPGGVQRLRELILELAITGDLIPKVNESEPASIFLETIALHREKLISEGKLRRQSPLPPIEKAELSFKLPIGWSFERLGNVCEIVRGVTFSSSQKQSVASDDNVPCLRTTNVQSEVEWRDLIFIARKLIGRDDQWIQKGDTLISMANSYELVGKVALVRVLKQQAAFGGFLAAIRPHLLLPEYIFLVLRSPYVQMRMRATASQTTNIANISLGGMRPIPVPIPPREEQARIVAKVDELMALCDKLEDQQKKKSALCAKARYSALAELTGSESPQVLQENWTRLHKNLALLIDSVDAANEMKSAIRELTIRGLLAPVCDDTVDSFLAEIQGKKQGKRFAKQTKPSEDFELPKGWKWVLLEDLLGGSDSGWSPKCDSEQRKDNEWGVLKVSAVTWGRYQPNENKKLPRSLEARPEFEVAGGDFLMSRANTAELVARSVIVPDDSPSHLMMSDKIVRLEFLDDRVKPWVNLVNNSTWARSYYKANATGTSDSMRNVSRQVIHELEVPLPPLELQFKLLNILESLEKHCDQLAKQIAKANKISSLLASSAIAAITGIRTEEEEALKTPKTELISKLRLVNNPDIKEQAPLAAILARHHDEMPASDLWQRYGGDIDAFYAQLKLEVGKGWIEEPAIAEMRETEAG
jgi:type I restriction enzyme S subunit